MIRRFIRGRLLRALDLLVILHIAARRRRAITAETLAEVWAGVMANPLYRWLLRTIYGGKKHFCLNTESLRVLTCARPEFLKHMKVSISPEFAEELRSGSQFVLVQIHDGPSSVNKLMVEHGRPFSRIVREPGPQLQRLAFLRGDLSCAHFIASGVTSMWKLRAAAAQGRVICSALDYEDEAGNWAYLNPAIFALARHLKLPVIFIRNDVDAEGCVRVHASPRHIVSDPESSAQAFQDFYNSFPGKKIDYVVKRYFG
jgi:hypothetical protein